MDNNHNKNAKILELFAEPLSYGGQEAFILNMYSNFTNKNIKYTFFTPYSCDNKQLHLLVKKKKDILTSRNKNFDSKLRKFYFITELKKYLKNNSFDIVHVHSGSTFSLAIGAKICKKNGAKKVIVHSHATGNDNIKYKIIKKTTKKMFEKYVDIYLACSEDAARWRFPREIVEKEKYIIIKNGINLEKFAFNNNTRKEYREKLKLKNSLTLINVGRLVKQKNQLFALKLLNTLICNNEDVKLILIGDGPQKKELINKTKLYHIENNVIFLEKRDDVNQILCAADIFLFPSEFEGLGIAAIEAQASGLPTICSEQIPKEVDVSENYHKASLQNINEWYKIVIANKQKTKRSNVVDAIANKGYDVKKCAEKLEQLYINLNEK